MAIRALSISATGGRALLHSIDASAQNLANVQTPAYKRARVNFAELLYQRLDALRAAGTGVEHLSTERVFAQGALERTGRDLDLAIEGEGFFRVRLPDGVAYTRSGRLRADAEGNLVTAEGYPLDPPLTFTGGRFLADAAGGVQGGGQIVLARFVNPSGLQARGESLYLETAASGPAAEGRPGETGLGWIRQGHLEGSNVDVVGELTDLIAAHRAFEINGKAIEAADEILKSINELRRERP